jgi:hypothetical protein
LKDILESVSNVGPPEVLTPIKSKYKFSYFVSREGEMYPVLTSKKVYIGVSMFRGLMKWFTKYMVTLISAVSNM